MWSASYYCAIFPLSLGALTAAVSPFILASPSSPFPFLCFGGDKRDLKGHFTRDSRAAEVPRSHQKEKRLHCRSRVSLHSSRNNKLTLKQTATANVIITQWSTSVFKCGYLTLVPKRHICPQFLEENVSCVRVLLLQNGYPNATPSTSAAYSNAGHQSNGAEVSEHS